MGRGLTDMQAPQGFAAETSSTAVLLASSHLGFALSTTHVVSGGVLGSGLGRKLAEAAVAFARRAGYREVVLWTHRELHAARRIYAGIGFRKTEEWIHHDFGPVSTGETWRLVLRRAGLGGPPAPLAFVALICVHLCSSVANSS